MLTCIARSKQSSNDASSIDPLPPPEKLNSAAPPSKQAIKILSSQIKDMALKASGAYRQCAPCAAETMRRSGSCGGGESGSERYRWSYRRAGSSVAGRRELEARLKGISSGEGTPASSSGRRVDPVVFVEESEPKEWVAQVEPGVLITFLSLPRGGNDLKQIKFSRETFNKWQAQRWWTENCEKVTELYNVQKLNRQAFPLPGDDDIGTSKKMESVEDGSPVTPPLGRERPTGAAVDSSSSEQSSMQSTSGTAKTEGSSVDDADRSGERLVSNGTSTETEWIEEDEPGVYITIRALPHGRRELKRVRFSREKFGEMHAKVWWEENRGRIHEQYL